MVMYLQKKAAAKSKQFDTTKRQGFQFCSKEKFSQTLLQSIVSLIKKIVIYPQEIGH